MGVVLWGSELWAQEWVAQPVLLALVERHFHCSAAAHLVLSSLLEPLQLAAPIVR